jgi:biopolymer transport protein ExbD
MSLLSAQQDNEVMAEINITPFTDVLLVLLIIFMILAALVTPPGFQKNLPDKNSNAPLTQKKPDNIEVLISQGGTIFVDGRKSDVERVYSDMYQARKQRGNKHVSLTADVKAPYGIVIRVLDAARQAGLDDVGFVTS